MHTTGHLSHANSPPVAVQRAGDREQEVRGAAAGPVQEHGRGGSPSRHRHEDRALLRQGGVLRIFVRVEGSEYHTER
jgi:hypothetical protein